jgi:ABC-type uncharacterized transport system auxiliary subunit
VGTIFWARDGVTGREVAVKKILIGRTTNLPALQSEIAMMAMSRHAAIIEYIESFMWEDALWVWGGGVGDS